MKIHLEHNGTILEYEHRPMPPERFASLCRLAGGAIGGVVLVALVNMVGIWAIVWAVVALAAAGAYKLIQSV